MQGGGLPDEAGQQNQWVEVRRERWAASAGVETEAVHISHRSFAAVDNVQALLPASIPSVLAGLRHTLHLLLYCRLDQMHVRSHVQILPFTLSIQFLCTCHDVPLLRTTSVH